MSLRRYAEPNFNRDNQAAPPSPFRTEDFRSFIETAKNLIVVELCGEPLFFQLVALSTFPVGKGTTDVFVFDVVFRQSNLFYFC